MMPLKELQLYILGLYGRIKKDQNPKLSSLVPIQFVRTSDSCLAVPYSRGHHRCNDLNKRREVTCWLAFPASLCIACKLLLVLLVMNLLRGWSGCVSS